jgi:predicted kinase
VGQPRLVLVSGIPGAGKSTLGRHLAQRMPCPLITKDEIKEGIVHARLQGSPEWGSPVAYESFMLFYRLVADLLDHGCSVVAEAAFARGVSDAEVEDLLARSDARIVHCQVDVSVAQARFVDRAGRDPYRHLSHPDAEMLRRMRDNELAWEQYDPLDVSAPILVVDTTDDYTPSYDAITSFARD